MNMLFIVKNTTKCSISDMVCPHFCRGCGEIGSVFCDCCKNDILEDHVDYCPVCKKETKNGRCDKCKLPFPVFSVGWRDEKVGALAEELKYKSVRAIGDVLAEMLDEILPRLGKEVIVVPLPTISRHVRERGLDHTVLVAKKLARKRGWKMERAIVRNTDTVQVGADRKMRLKQMKCAYKIDKKFVPQDKIYLLLDDVWTTGASMKAAAKIMQKAGAKKNIATVVAISRDKD